MTPTDEPQHDQDDHPYSPEYAARCARQAHRTTWASALVRIAVGLMRCQLCNQVVQG